MNKKITTIIREDYPITYNGYKFITLIQFNEEQYLSIVDRLTDKTLSAYIIDLCGPKQINEEQLLDIAFDWSESSRNETPISYEFARLNIIEVVQPLYRVFNVDFVERVIGPLPAIESHTINIKRKKRKILTKTLSNNQ